LPSTASKHGKVLETLLDKYADTGIENIEDIKVLTLDPFKSMGSASELVSAFGNKSAYMAALHELEQLIFTLDIYQSQYPKFLT
jgi:type I restriction enzyme R subunit